jgi:hypothetical protein
MHSAGRRIGGAGAGSPREFDEGADDPGTSSFWGGAGGISYSVVLSRVNNTDDASRQSIIHPQNNYPRIPQQVIAHRLGTVVKSDNIAVVKQGVVVEQGTHAALMSAGAVGHYRQLMATQQTAYLND